MSFDFSTLFGEGALRKPGGETTPVSSLASAKVVAVYFSAHWCGPCRGFTPKLADVYNDLKAAGKPFEIVFVSSDRDEEAFKEYHDSMPWLALNYADRAAKQALSEKYGCRGIPYLVLLGDDGEVISNEGRAIVSDHGALGFPFTPERLVEAQGEKARLAAEALKALAGFSVLGAATMADGAAVDLAAAEHVVLFFGNSDDNVSRQYIGPKLAEEAGALKKKGAECLFVPWGGAVDAEFRASLPFAAVAAPDDAARAALKASFDPAPSKVCVVSKGCERVVVAGCERALYNSGAGGFPWTPERLAELEKEKEAAAAALRDNLVDFKALAGEGRDYLVRNKGEQEPLSGLVKDGAVVALYYSAHWCGPCRGFTPKLVEVYNELKAAGKPFEVVFVSSDSDQASFDEYFGEMPWLALPYAERALKDTLSEAFGVEGIPTLVLLDGHGKELTREGRAAVTHGAEYFPWGPEEMQKATAEAKGKAAKKLAAALAEEAAVAEAQKAAGRVVFGRVRGAPGGSKLADAASETPTITFGAFDTFACATPLAAGKVYYEVEAVSVGPCPQYGWASRAYEPGTERTGNGVGDCAHSWGVDGARGVKWHNGTSKYEVSWSHGAVVGCAADLDAGTLRFSCNGKWLDAPEFEGVKPDGGLAPAVTNQAGTAKLNFGDAPFKFAPPDDTYISVAAAYKKA